MNDNVNNSELINVSEVLKTKIQNTYSFGFGISVTVFDTDNGREAIITNKNIGLEVN